MTNSFGAEQVILAALINRPVTVQIGDWSIIVRPEDNWYDDEDGWDWEGPMPRVEHTKLEHGVLQSVLKHVPSSVNLAFVTEEVAYVGRRMGYHNLIPMPPVANPSVTLKVELAGPVVIGSERDGGRVYVNNGDGGPYLNQPINDISELPEYSFGTVYLVSKELAKAALEEGRYDVVANT